MREYRARQRHQPGDRVTRRNRVTAPELDQHPVVLALIRRIEALETKLSDRTVRPSDNAKGRRWGGSEDVPDEWRAWAVEALEMTRQAVDEEAVRFSDYWRSKAGAAATKRDWLATWRNWCRKALTDFAPRAGGLSGEEEDMRRLQRAAQAYNRRAEEGGDGQTA